MVLRFEEAIMLAKNGRFVKFSDWQSEYVTLISVNNQMMLVRCSATSVAPYQPTQKEMLLDSWEVVKAPNTEYLKMDNFVRLEYEIAYVYHEVNNASAKYGVARLVMPQEVDEQRDRGALEFAIAGMLPELIDDLKIVRIVRL